MKTASVSTEVECCLCGGEMMEDFDCGTEYASYLCNSCGYASNSEAAESPRKALRGIPRKFRPFVKWAGFAEDSGAVLHGDMPWWPGGVEMLTEYSVFPVVVSGKLRWRREDIEEIPESERKHHPREDWLSGYYEYRSAPYHADYDSFHEACEATREQNLANALPLTSTKKLSIQLLGND
jgi:hypothetical protein